MQSNSNTPQSPSSEQKPSSIFPTLVNVQGHLSNQSQLPEKQQQLLKQQDEDISEELRMLLQEFNRHDRKQLGMVAAEEVRGILETLGYPTQDLEEVVRYATMTKEGFITFDELLAVITEVELNAEYADQDKIFAKRELKTDRRLIGFLKLLDQYRKKCQKDGNYKQAKKSKVKIQQIKQKQGIRKRNFLRVAHVEQLNNIEQIQRKQFEEFSNNWDLYMGQYEQVALQSLERLKDKHMKELNDLTAELKLKLEPKIHFSKYILELRTKERNLAKLKQYDEAEKIRHRIQELEQEQLAQHHIQVNQTMQLRVSNLKKQQVSVLNALLKRIQRDRNQQLRQRQRDSQTLIIKNRNIRNDLTHKHQQQVKKAVESLREFMNMNLQDDKGNTGATGGAQVQGYQTQKTQFERGNRQPRMSSTNKK